MSKSILGFVGASTTFSWGKTRNNIEQHPLILLDIGIGLLYHKWPYYIVIEDDNAL